MQKRVVIIPWFGEPRHKGLRGFCARAMGFRPENRQFLMLRNPLNKQFGFFQVNVDSLSQIEAVCAEYIKRYLGELEVSRGCIELASTEKIVEGDTQQLVVINLLLSSAEWLRMKTCTSVHSGQYLLRRVWKIEWKNFQELEYRRNEGLLDTVTSYILTLNPVRAFLRGVPEESMASLA